MQLVLETKDQPDLSPQTKHLMLTPPIDEDYWLYRVRLGADQAIVAFPKFGIIGIGFAREEDWNTNLPYRCSAEEIYQHIAHNKGDDSITREHCIEAIRIIQNRIHDDASKHTG